MNNNERLVDDNSTVSIQDNEKESPMEIQKLKNKRKVVLLFVNLPLSVYWPALRLL